MDRNASSRKKKIRHSSTVQDAAGLSEIQKKNSFNREINCACQEWKPPRNKHDCKPKVIEKIDRNCRIARSMYQSLFVDVTDFFLQYIHSL